MVGAQSLAARILANVVIWSVLFYGFFFIGAFKDYPVGFELAILSACAFDGHISQHICNRLTARQLLQHINTVSGLSRFNGSLQR